MNEIEWVERLRARFGFPDSLDTVGIGDDACVLTFAAHESLVTTVDTVVEGVHFRNEWLSNEELASRAIRVSVSDLAAMGAAPRGVLLALETTSLPGRFDDAFFDGVASACGELGTTLLGGNVTKTSGPLSISVTALGAVTHGMAILRSTARAGDELYVSGSPGLASTVLDALLAGSGVDASKREAWIHPEPRLELARRLSRGDHVTAAIDLSDGLAMDLGRLLRSSDVGATVDLSTLEEATQLDLETILRGGEDYELLVAIRPGRDAELASIAEQLAVPLTRIGHVNAQPGIELRGRNGVWTGSADGWDPFAG